MKLRGKQKRYLRSQANHMRPIFSIGKAGIDQNWLNHVVDALNNRELIKVNILQNADLTTDQATEYIIKNSNVQVVQVIGKTLLLFMKAQKPGRQHISLAVESI